MPLNPEHRQFLDDWVQHTLGNSHPNPQDQAYVAIAAELDRLGRIETATRRYIQASQYAWALDATRHPDEVIQQAIFAETNAYEALRKLVEEVPDGT